MSVARKHRNDPLSLIETGQVLHAVPSEPNGAFFESAVPGESKGVMLDIPQAAKFLGWTEKVLKLRVSRREVPFIRIGRRVFFTRKLLDNWLIGNVVEPRSGPIPLFKRRI